MHRLPATVLGFLVLAIYILGSNRWVRNDGWYRSLQQPSWQPPDFIFGLIWPYNFIVLGIATFIITRNASAISVLIFLATFSISVVFALRWSYLFYHSHNLSGAAISLASAAVFTAPILLVTFNYSYKLGLALIPYQIWIAIAASLSYGYSRLN